MLTTMILRHQKKFTNGHPEVDTFKLKLGLSVPQLHQAYEMCSSGWLCMNLYHPGVFNMHRNLVTHGNLFFD